MARSLPWMALGEIEQGNLIAGTLDDEILKSTGAPTVTPFTRFHTVDLIRFQLLERAREITSVIADSDSTAVITCRQISDASAALGLTPTMLGPPPRIASTPNLDAAIAGGRWRIEKSVKNGCKKLYSQADTVAALDASIQRDDWGEVVGQVVATQCKSDLTYFLLGRAMEALSYTDAAIAFYREAAKYRGGTFSFSTQCKLNRGMQSCHGINVQNETDVALVRLLLASPAGLGPYSLRQPG